jgi:hypothetical protein
LTGIDTYKRLTLKCAAKKEKKMTDKKKSGIPAWGLVFVLGLVLAGCPNEAADPNQELVQNLKPYAGASVSSKVEVSTLAQNSLNEVEKAINAALEKEPVSSSVHAAPRVSMAANGKYSHNGVTVQFSKSFEGDAAVYTYKETRKVTTIEGTYEGYTISGTGLDIQYSDKHKSADDYTIEITYNCAYSVSYNDKGMKVAITGKTTQTAQQETVEWHYKAYDNNNTALFSVDYNNQQPK